MLGLDVDQVLLDSPTTGTRTESPTAPVVDVTAEGRTSYDLDLTGIDGPFWLVLGQSHSLGWTASMDGLGDLGEPELVDGYANGWWIDPGEVAELTVQLRWWPQRVVNVTIVASGVAALVCLGLAVRRPRRRASADLRARSEPTFEPVGFGPSAWRSRSADRATWRAGIQDLSVPALVGGALAILLWVLVASPPTGHIGVSLALLLFAAGGGRWRWASGVGVAVIYGLLGVSIVVAAAIAG